jgi:energy-coupling factor transporter ATP-binding protein EcfA2
VRLTLRKVRSFVDQHEIELRPLTLLVGENSAGKTTFLAMADAVLNDRYLRQRPTFNVPPYNLGSFDDIATFLGGRSGRSSSFSIGLTRTANNESFVSTFEGEQGQPTLSRLEAGFLDSKFTATFSGSRFRIQGQIGPTTQARAIGRNGVSEGRPLELDLQTDLPEDASTAEVGFDWRFLLAQPFIQHDEKTHGDTSRRIRTLIGLQNVWPTLFSPGPSQAKARSIAPVRTRPHRVYDRAQEQPDPEGDYIPFVLARTLLKPGGESEALRRALSKFGTESGLFAEISARRLSRKTLWPFQIEVENSGPSKNLIDVGYGVSQALPVLVESILPGPKTLLVQQPEVHLHPRAQAALGTFFAELVAQDRRTFVVETHSDHLVDRVRLAVAQKVIKPEQVSIVFFHRPRSKTKTYELKIDELGNVLHAPDVYREFFLHEQMRLLQDS